MPVEDHPIHERVIEKDGTKWGCWNSERTAAGYYVLSRIYDDDGTYQLRPQFIPHRMSVECRNDISLKDPKCRFCKWQGSGEAYDRSVRENGK